MKKLAITLALGSQLLAWNPIKQFRQQHLSKKKVVFAISGVAVTGLVMAVTSKPQQIKVHSVGEFCKCRGYGK